MAIALNASTTPTDTTGTSHTITHTAAGANRLAVATVSINSTTDLVTGVTYDGAAMTRLATLQGSIGRRIYVYYILQPNTTASANVVASTSGSTVICLGVVTYTGVSQSGFPDASTTSERINTQNPATSLTTIADNCWTHLCACEQAGNFNPGAGTGSTSRGVDAGFQTGQFDSNAAITPAGSTSMTITSDSADRDWIIIMHSFAPVATVSTKGALLMSSLL